MDPDQFNQVLDAMFEYPADPGHHVIDEGDDGDNFYVIENGVYDVYKVSLIDNFLRTKKDARGFRDLGNDEFSAKLKIVNIL